MTIYHNADPILADLTEEEITMVSLLCLFTANQEKCYINYHEGLKLLDEWLIGDDFQPGDFKFTDRYAPDICANCATEYKMTVGGRIRFYCPTCDDTPNCDISFFDRLLSYYNPTFLEEIFEQGSETVQFYMSIAAALYKEHGSRKGLWKPIKMT